ncbi:hypothetical protein HKX48_003936 [Thoreauomyces humboldtii]|nr:hypothetical protein HKX48_003936 [Thoreauomyces humboldtii]
MPAQAPLLSTPLSQVLLYGGAISISLPHSFIDVSSLREVPSNQEVFVHASTDRCFMVELLETDTDVPDDRMGAFHWSQLAEDNGAEEQDISTTLMGSDRKTEETSDVPVPLVDRPCTTVVVTGFQWIAKFNERSATARNQVSVRLAVVRIPSVGTDLLVSYNHPVVIGQDSSSNPTSAGQEGNGAAVAALDMTEGDVDLMFRRVVGSLKVLDWGLFGA